MLFQPSDDYGQYDERCDVYSLAITLAEAVPAPKNGNINELVTQLPHFAYYQAGTNEVQKFIREKIQAAVCW